MKLILFEFIFFFSITNLSAATFEDFVVSSDRLVSNKTLHSYANRWWQWSYAVPHNFNPVRDINGEDCHRAQKGPVWFLAGANVNTKISRTCEMPKGKYIFFPIINNVSIPKGKISVSCDSAKKSAVLINPELLSITVELNSLKLLNLTRYRLTSKNCFDILGLIPRKRQPPTIFPAASDGYWIMLKPLPKGKHKLSFLVKQISAKHKNSRVIHDIEYTINIK